LLQTRNEARLQVQISEFHRLLLQTRNKTGCRFKCQNFTTGYSNWQWSKVASLNVKISQPAILTGNEARLQV
jgi:hypothetical protein